MLDKAYDGVKNSIMESLCGKRYAIVTDGWSRRTAVRGAPLININICVDDGPALFWRVEDSSGLIKGTQYVVSLHQ
jgi:hypothetical protein